MQRLKRVDTSGGSGFDEHGAGAGDTFWTTTAIVAFAWFCIDPARGDDVAPRVTFEHGPDQVEILVEGRPFATYVYRDEQITRPYLCNVHAPCGEQVTRPHPIIDGELDDHPTMHPGIWLAFGDLSGEDYWRLKAPVVHALFLDPPQGGAGRGSFAVRNHYLTRDGDAGVCQEACRITVLADDKTTTILWNSTFHPVKDPIVFGDQEEMGLGVRIRRLLAEESDMGGLLTDSAGRTSANEVWGQAADWCDYSGVVNNQPLGITILAHPKNPRKSWWHARDYGFMAANLFGRQAMKQGEPSRIIVRPGEQLQLRYAIIVHNGRPAEGYDPDSVLSGSVEWP